MDETLSYSRKQPVSMPAWERENNVCFIPVEPRATTVLGFLMPAWQPTILTGIGRTSGLTMRAGSSSPALGWAHNNKRTWWLQWNFVGVLHLRPQMQYSTSGQTMRGACIWIVPHSECSPGFIWFTQVSAFFGPNHDQEPQPEPPQPHEEMGVDLTHTVWRDPCTADMSRYLSRNVLYVGGVRDIPDILPILKHDGVTALILTKEGDPGGWWKPNSQKTEGALSHRKCCLLAGGNWRPTGTERVTKM